MLLYPSLGNEFISIAFSPRPKDLAAVELERSVFYAEGVYDEMQPCSALIAFGTSFRETFYLFLQGKRHLELPCWCRHVNKSLSKHTYHYAGDDCEAIKTRSALAYLYWPHLKGVNRQAYCQHFVVVGKKDQTWCKIRNFSEFSRIFRKGRPATMC